MEDLDLFDASMVHAADVYELLIRFAFNSLFMWIIIHKLYYPKSLRKNYYFTFALISVSVFFLIFLLGSVKIKVGFALGLFAIFGIIRYRTETMSVREMTYLFVIITLSVINALAPSSSYVILAVTNVIIILCVYFCERLPWVTHLSEKLVLYDRVELIVPERRAELIDDLKNRLGFDVEKIEIGAVDFMRDSVMLKVYYKDKECTDNMINHSLKIPREQ